TGASHAPTFVGRGKFAIPTQKEPGGDEAEAQAVDFAVHDVPGVTAKQAKQRAALLLIARASKVPLETYPPVRPPKEPPAPEKPGKPEGGRSSVSVLLERTQAAKAAAPAYTFRLSGPAHLPTVQCTCIALDTQAAATAKSKADAKAIASSLVLQELERRESAAATKRGAESTA
ncbi:MAG: putative dsRNA-binding protein, partial [Polyangiales bacterium]